jgi:predicted GIY-YIG superfamily endonuclease
MQLNTEQMIPVKWAYLGCLDSLDQSKQISGVYVYIFRGTPRRLIYVGTSIDIVARMNQHIKHMKEGLHTFFRAQRYSDIYSLMSIPSELDREEYIKTLPGRVRDIWIPANPPPKGAHLLNSQTTFQTWNQQFLQVDFMPNVEVWCCSIADKYQKMLESQLQLKFRDAYRIGYYNLRENFSWLGKIECDVQNAFSVVFKMDPDLLPTSLEESDKRIFLSQTLNGY